MINMIQKNNFKTTKFKLRNKKSMCSLLKCGLRPMWQYDYTWNSLSHDILACF